MSDPVLWAKRGPIPSRRAFVWKDGQRVPAEDDLGRPIFERVPQAGKVGLVRQVADIDGLRPQSQPRYITYLRDDGHVTNNVITGAAASVPGTDKSYEIALRQKARFKGWIQWGTCPIDAALRQDITGLQLVDQGNREAFKRREPCPHGTVGPRLAPCKHFVAEEQARREMRAEGERRSVRKSAADRQAEAFVDLAETMKARIEDTEAPAPVRRKRDKEPSE